MSKGKVTSRVYGIKGIAFVALGLALLTAIAAYGKVAAGQTFFGRASELVGLQGVLQLNRQKNAASNLPLPSEVSPLDVSVSLPNVSSTPGLVLVPVTVSDLTSLSIFSYDLQVTFDPSVVAPASPAFETPGTLSSASTITSDTINSGHMILGGSQASPFDGSGTLIFLRFNVIGTSGQSSGLLFQDYTDPGSIFHPGFRFNAGTPAAITANGSITVTGPTPTSTSTSTPTNTPAFTPTNTPTASPTGTPICGTASIPAVTSLTNVPVSVPVNVANMSGTGAVSVNFTVTFSPGVMNFNGVSFGTVGNSNGGGRTLSFSTPTSNSINVSIFGGNEILGSGPLVNLNFNVFSQPGTQSLLNFTSYQINGGPSCSTLTNGSVTVVAGTVTGNVTYGNIIGPPFPRNVPNVTISGNGSPFVSALTDTFGNYSLSGFGSGSYNITPSKTGGANGAISGFDSGRIAQYVVSLITFTQTQIDAADVSGNGNVSSYDATLIARFTVGLPPPVGLTGSWVFSPTSISHPFIYSNIANDNFSALLMGDTSANWNHPNSLPRATRPDNFGGPERSAVVKAPDMTVFADGDVIIPVNIQGAAKKGVISYEFDLRYDSAVIQPHTRVIDLNGTVSNALNAVANATEPGLLRVIVFGPVPIDADGMLLNLRFTAVGAPGSVSPLTWERLMLNEGDPQVLAVDGRVELSTTISKDAEIAGRVLTPFGTGIPNARVTLTDTTGRSRTIISNSFGAYRFGNLQDGETYTIRVDAKNYTFTLLAISVTRQSTNHDIIAGP